MDHEDATNVCQKDNIFVLDAVINNMESSSSQVDQAKAACEPGRKGGKRVRKKRK